MAPEVKKARSTAYTNANMEESQLMKLFEDELQDIYWAEKALVKTLPKMSKKASSDELIHAIETHLKETEGHVKKVEAVFESLDKKATARKCEAMDGLIKEGEKIMKDAEDGPMRDAAIISAAQKVEHYEIASYGTLCAFTKTLGFDRATGLLSEILKEEKAADSRLTGIAESSINVQAALEEK